MLRTLLRIFNFFVPIDVLSGVFLVFALENAMAAALGPIGIGGWIVVYFVGLVLVVVFQYYSADGEEMDEFEDALDDLNGND